ncbi:MAG: hypothetical protein EXX96DRAFT_653506 [Benjaminiella poitrasii]|nr:MAG: hypothetical protein EXX96DRAFT_653506 [Benjaminiella poitrasii]
MQPKILRLMSSACTTTSLYYLSPQTSSSDDNKKESQIRVITGYRNGISSRPYLQRDLHKRLIENHEDEEYPLPLTSCEYLHAAIDSEAICEQKKNEEECLESLEELFTQIYKVYEVPMDYDNDSDENTFNQLFMWPYLYLINESLKFHHCKRCSVQGQLSLGEYDPAIESSKNAKNEQEATAIQEEGLRHQLSQAVEGQERTVNEMKKEKNTNTSELNQTVDNLKSLKQELSLREADKQKN